MNWLKCKLQVDNNWDVKNKAKFQPCTDYLNLIYYPTCLIVFVVFSNVCVCVCVMEMERVHACMSMRITLTAFFVFIFWSLSNRLSLKP